MKFLLVGNGGFHNRGCEAISLMSAQVLAEIFPNCEIVFSSFFEKDRLPGNFNNNIRYISAVSQDMWKIGTRDWTKRKFFEYFFKEKAWEVAYSQIARECKTADAVLSIGGDNYSSDYKNALNYYMELSRIIKRSHRPFIVWAASIGPFNLGEGALQQIVDDLKNADLITARESATVSYLRTHGITANVRLTADPAFLLPATPVTEDILDLNSQYLGFNISPILEDYTEGALDGEHILAESAAFLNQVIRDTSLKVLLVPHAMRPNNWNNDYDLLNSLIQKTGAHEKIKILPNYLNAGQLKYFISRCRFFIGARTHSTIAALSSYVPTVSISYSLKSKGINNDIFGGHEFLISSKEINHKNLWDKFERMRSAEAQIKKTLSQKIPFMKELALANGLYLKEKLSANS